MNSPDKARGCANCGQIACRSTYYPYDAVECLQRQIDDLKARTARLELRIAGMPDHPMTKAEDVDFADTKETDNA